MVVFNIFREETRIDARRLRCESNELLQLLHVGIILGGGHTLDCLGKIRNDRHNFVSVDDFGILYVPVLEVDNIGKSFAPRCFDVAIVRAVMVLGREKVPFIDRMIMSSSLLVAFLMYFRRTPHWSNRHFILVKGPLK